MAAQGEQSHHERRFPRRRADVPLITSARQSPQENRHRRQVVYAIMQWSRIPLLVLSGVIIVYWQNWIAATLVLVISVPLPWIAVVIANGVGEPRDRRAPQVYKPQAAREAQAHYQAVAAARANQELPGAATADSATQPLAAEQPTDIVDEVADNGPEKGEGSAS